MAWTCNSADCQAVRTNFNPDEWLGIDPAGHAYEALAWLLRAAQEWRLQEEAQIGVDGYAPTVYSMDSVILRTRLLFEFFHRRGPNYVHAECLFGIAQPAGPSDYPNWMNQIHVGSVHLQNRSAGGQLQEYGGTAMKDLNKMPADLARGVLESWQNFEKELDNSGDTANKARAEKARLQAEEDSRRVVHYAKQRSEAYSGANFDKLTVLF